MATIVLSAAGAATVSCAARVRDALAAAGAVALEDSMTGASFLAGGLSAVAGAASRTALALCWPLGALSAASASSDGTKVRLHGRTREKKSTVSKACHG